MIRPERCSLAIALVIAASAATASADEPPKSDPVVAEALFKAARALVDAGDHAAGCPKFEASLALYPSASTMINIARCREHEGKLASAWAGYSRALAQSHTAQPTDRQRALDALARQAIAALEPRLPRLRIVVNKPPPGLTVLRDGQELPPAVLGEAIPADPGQHEVSVSAPGYRGETRSVLLEEGKTATVEVSLQFVITSPTPAALPPRATDSTAPTAPAWAWISGAAGVALTGVAVGFLVDDLAAIRALRSRCRTDASGTRCDAGYDYAADNARKNRDVALMAAFGGAGLLALGAGIYGVARAKAGAPTDRPVATAWITPSAGGVVLSGGF